eukprot:symbB.v1.2.012873.t1/scaffold875.1/size155714/22
MLRGEEFEKDVLNRRAADRVLAEQTNWAATACFEWFQHFISNPAMPGIWQSSASFGAAFIAMQAYGPGRPVLDPWQPNQAVVYEYGANISDFWQVFYAVRGASSFFTAVETYKRSQQNLSRALSSEQLQIRNEAISKRAREGCCIAFDEVSIETPTGTPLLAGLTFKVEPGRHLVICGHNGAGKSSIFRCLAGLWPIAKGAITCPNACASGLHGDVYYLPQRPVNIMGTLSDQLTYPRQISDGLPIDDMRRWLSYVGMADFVDHAVENGSLAEEADWGSRLASFHGVRQPISLAL